jgi:hypothetical protein
LFTTKPLRPPFTAYGYNTEKCEAEDLQDFAEAPFQPEFFLDDRDEYVNADRDPHLNLHRVVARPVEGFDMQILFDPFEKQLDVPAIMPSKSAVWWPSSE